MPSRVPAVACPHDTLEWCPWWRSVGFNDITGPAAERLADAVLAHKSMTEFCGIPLVAMREDSFKRDSVTDLNLTHKGVGMPGALVLSKLLPVASGIKTLKCAHPKAGVSRARS